MEDRFRRDKEKKVFELEAKRKDACLLYTSDAADERSSVDLGGRRIIKKKTEEWYISRRHGHRQNNNNSTWICVDFTYLSFSHSH